MSRALARLLLLVGLAALVVLSRQRLAEERGAPGPLAPEDPPSSLFGVMVFGGFRPLFLEMLWSQADTLARAGRIWELIDVHERIARLDPDNARVRLNQAWLMAFDLAQSEPDDRERWRLLRRALAHVDRGLAHAPDHEALLELRFLIWYRLIAPDPEASARARRDLGFDGLEGALDAAAAFRKARPELEAGWTYEIGAGEEAIESLLNRGRMEAARAALDATLALLEETRRRFPSAAWDLAAERHRRLAVVLETLAGVTDWDRVAAGEVADVDFQRLERAVEQTLAWLELGLETGAEGETFTGAVIALIQFRCMELAQALALADRDSDALRVAEHVRIIARLAAGRTGPRTPYYTEAYVDAFAAHLETDRAYRRALAAPRPPSEELESRWSQGLETLDRMLKERAGVTDRFTRRLRERARR